MFFVSAYLLTLMHSKCLPAGRPLFHRMIICSLFVAVVFSSPQSARAIRAVEDVYDTVDAVEPHNSTYRISGVLAGTTSPVSRFYFGTTERKPNTLQARPS